MKRNAFRFRLLRQALLQKKAKAIIILLAVLMGSSVVAALLNLQIDLRARMNRELRDYGPNVVLQPLNSGDTISKEFVTNLQSAPLMQRAIAYTPQFIAPVRVHNKAVLLAVVDISAYRKLYPSQDWKLWEDSDVDSVYIGKRLADQLRVRRGNRLKFQFGGRDFELPIAGTVESGEIEDDQIFLSIETAANIHLQNAGYHSVLFSVLGDLPDVEEKFRAITEQFPEVQYHIIRKIAAAEENILDKISNLMGLVILLIFIILFFCIHTTVSAILLSRQAEIALLRVLGAKRKQIASLITSELLLLGFIGGLAGYGTGIVMAQILGRVLFQSFVTPSALVFVVTLVFSLVLMGVSSFLPISRSVNRPAALVLKEA